MTVMVMIWQAVTAGILLPGADFTAQLIERTKAKTDDTEVPPLDLARTARFAIFGFALQAPWNHFYYLVLDQLIPPSPDPLSATTAAKVAIDQFVQAPIFTIIIFAFLGLLEGKSTDEIKGKLDADYKSTMVRLQSDFKIAGTSPCSTLQGGVTRSLNDSGVVPY